MRKAKTASGSRGPEALARVQRNALNALQAWENELEGQLEMVRSQIQALSGPAQVSAPAAPKRRRKAAKKTAKRRGRKPGRKPAKRTAKKKTAKKRGRKSVGRPAKKTARKKTARKAAAKKTARKTTRKAAKKTAKKRGRKPGRKTAKKAGGRKKQTMIQAIVQLLKDKGRPLRPVEIARFITQEKRYPTKSKNVYNAVMTNLVRSKDVKKNKGGAYVPA